jgi:flagellar protein FlbD
MIELTRFNGERFVLNADQIEMVEATPDTIIRLLNGKKIVVRETVQTVVERALDYARRVHCIAAPPVPGNAPV